MSKDNRKIIISRDVTFDEKLSPATSTQVPWYIDKDTEKYSSISISILTPLTSPTIQHGLQQQAIIDPNIPNPHIPSNIGLDTYTTTEGVPLTSIPSPSTLYLGEASSSHSTHQLTNDPNINWHLNDIYEDDHSPQKPTNLYDEFSRLSLDNGINAFPETFHDSSAHIPRSSSPPMRRPQRVNNPRKRLLESIEERKPIKSKPKRMKQALLVNP
jgi:hypothetical protein